VSGQNVAIVAVGVVMAGRIVGHGPARRLQARLADVRAASEYSSLSQEAIRTAHKRGRLKGSKGDSGRLMFRVEDVDIFLGDE